MGRPKGSKNKKTLAKLAKAKPYKKDTNYASKIAARASDNESQCVQHRLNILENQVLQLTNASRNETMVCLKNKLETLDGYLCTLLTKIDLIEKTLSPLMFVERTNVGLSNENEKESCSEEAC